MFCQSDREKLALQLEKYYGLTRETEKKYNWGLSPIVLFGVSERNRSSETLDGFEPFQEGLILHECLHIVLILEP